MRYLLHVRPCPVEVTGRPIPVALHVLRLRAAVHPRSSCADATAIAVTTGACRRRFERVTSRDEADAGDEVGHLARRPVE